MAVTVLAEIGASGNTIVMAARGYPEDMGPAMARLQTLTPLIEKIKPTTEGAPGGLKMPLTWPAVVQLKAALGPAYAPGPRLAQWVTDQVLTRATALRGELIQPVVDNGMTPRTYQVSGARLIAATGHAILTDEPGTGKTCSTILGLRELLHRGVNIFPVLCVVPNSVVNSWLDELAAWAPEWRAIAWRGSPEQRRRIGRFASSYDVFVCSYDTAVRDAAHSEKRGPKDNRTYSAPLMALGARSIVSDEVHLIKSQASSRAWAVRRLSHHAAHFIALSGTPITHGPDDLWTALDCLVPGAWPSKERWTARYCDTIPAQDYGAAKVLGLDQLREPEFRLTIHGQHRRVAKQDVLDQLPPKVYTVRTVAIPKEWRKAYDAMESDMIAQLPDDGGELPAMGTLAQLTRLQQLASSACDVTVTTEPYEDKETGMWLEKEVIKVEPKAPSWKVDELLAVLGERPGAQVLAFAHSKKLMMLAGRAAEAAGYRVAYVVGGQVQTKKYDERKEYIDGFQRGEYDLLCATTQAGGVGITLTAASTVVFLQRPWSLVDALQAEDRAHRIGSEVHECIEVIDVVAENTIETRIRSVLKGKADQLGKLVQDPRIVAQLLGGTDVIRINRKAS